MKAIVQDRYGSADVLELKDIDQPEIGDDDVLVRVHAAGAHIGDWHFMTGLPYLFRIAGSGLRAPKARVRGTDVAGRVEAVGKDVTRFQPGDEVFGTCDGSFAEYATARARQARAEAGEPHLRAGGGRPHLRAAPPSRLFATRGGAAGAEGADHRRGGRRGDVRGADRQGVRR